MILLVTKGLGALLAVAGLLLSALPGLVLDLPPNQERFAAIETRTRFGALGGLGLGLSLLAGFSPWAFALAFLAFWSTVGFVFARILGLCLDGYHQRQLMWIGFEVVAASALGWYLWA